MPKAMRLGWLVGGSCQVKEVADDTGRTAEQSKILG